MLVIADALWTLHKRLYHAQSSLSHMHVLLLLIQILDMRLKNWTKAVGRLLTEEVTPATSFQSSRSSQSRIQF